MTDDPKEKVAKAIADHDNACYAYEIAVKAKRADVAEALAVVNAKHADTIARAEAEMRDTLRVMNEAKSADASHPWEGIKVSRSRSRHNGSLIKPSVTKEFGIVEVRRAGTKLPANQKYGLPAIGRAFVRILRADGTPGLKIDNLSGWSLVEEGGA